MQESSNTPLEFYWHHFFTGIKIRKFCYIAKCRYRIHFDTEFLTFLTLFRIGEALPTSFFPVTSTNVGFRPQNFLTFSFKPFFTLVQNFKFVPSTSPKLLDLNQDHPSKKRFLWSNPYKIDVMITFLIEMLHLPNFGHMTTSIIWFQSLDKILLVTSWTEIMTS